MLEPDVALSDYFLTVECALFVWLLLRRMSSIPAARNGFVCFFSATGSAALLGGTVHGFFALKPSTAEEVLWRLSLCALGVSAFSLWWLWGVLFFYSKMRQGISYLATIEFILFAVYVLTASRSFSIAIADYIPPIVILMFSLLRLYLRQRNTRVLQGAFGLGLALIASYLQQRRLGIDPLYFNHNAVYHVLQAAALFLVFRATRPLIMSTAAKDPTI